MDKLTVDILKKVIENVPDDFTLDFDNGKQAYKLGDEIQINVSDKKLIFKKY